MRVRIIGETAKDTGRGLRVLGHQLCHCGPTCDCGPACGCHPDVIVIETEEAAYLRACCGTHVAVLRKPYTPEELDAAVRRVASAGPR